MTHISSRQMLAFADELSKTAAVPKFLGTMGKYISNIPKSYGGQLMLGAGLGGTANVARHAITDPQDIQSDTGSNFFHGALAGSSLAGGRILATKAGREAVKRTGSKFLQRERYGLTGQGLGDDPLTKARELGILSNQPTAQTMFKMDPHQLTSEQADQLASNVKKWVVTNPIQEDAFNKGYLNAPGALYGLMSHPIDTIRSGWRRGGALGKLLTVGGVAGGIKGVVETPEEEGPGRLEKGLGGAASALGWAAAPPMWVGGALMGSGIGRLGSSVGKTIDTASNKLRARGRVIPAEE